MLNEPGGPAVTVDEMASLDVQAPAAVIALLAGRTGVSPDDVRSLTLAGWVPWLLDTLDPEPVPGAAFDTYVRQDSVLLTTKERPGRRVPGWRAWLSADPKRGPLRRACPTCQGPAATDTGAGAAATDTGAIAFDAATVDAATVDAATVGAVTVGAVASCHATPSAGSTYNSGLGAPSAPN